MVPLNFNVNIIKIKTLVIIIAVILLFMFLRPFKIISPGNRGIIINFGAVSPQVLNEGIHFRIPIYQTIREIDVRVQKEETDAAAASKDLQQISSKVAVNFNVVPELAAQLYQNVGMDYKSKIIDPAIQESIKAVTAKYTAEELITKRQDVSTEIKEILAAKLKPLFKVDNFNIINFDFSKEFNAAIESKQTAQQLALKAQQDLVRIKIEAEQKVTQAQAEAKSLEAQKAQITPELVELRKVEAQLKAIEKWNGVMPQYAGGDGTIFNIPTK